jgi:adenosine deaminase
MALLPIVPITEDFIRRLPKTDLHCHLDGSLRLSTILDLAEQQGVELPADTEEGLASAIHMGENCESLSKYLEAFDVTLSVMQNKEGLHRTAYELGMDASAEGVRLLEVRFSPLLHTRQGMQLTTIIEVVAEGLRQAKRETGLMSGLIVCGIRNISPEASLRLAELAVAYKNKSVVGFDLAGEEHNYPAKAHREAFYLMRNNNVNCTCHAGEAYGPESIHQAIHVCGSHRIGHGVRLREDGELLNYVNDHRIPMECCPSSNVQTGAVPDLASHPLKFYYDFGLRVTINTDNRLITDTTVSKEMFLAHKHLDFGIKDIRELTLNGFKSAFVHYRKKQELVKRFMAQFDEIVVAEASGADADGSDAAKPGRATKASA